MDQSGGGGVREKARGRGGVLFSWWARRPWGKRTPHFLDLSAGQEPEPVEKPGCRERIKDAAPGCRGCLVKLLVALVLLQVLFQWQRRCPPVRGEVVEHGTGRPVAGAIVHREMMGYSRNFLQYIGGGSTSPLLPWKPRTTDSAGAFRFPTAWTALAADPLMLLYGPPLRTGISILVYSPDHIPVVSYLDGFDPSVHEGRSRSGFAFHLERKGTFWLGYRYRIEMERAETQEQWEAKCAATLSLSGRYAPREIADEWVFQDLTRYLERWPQGEKAGEYGLFLIRMAFAEIGRFETAREPISRENLEAAKERVRTILAIAETISSDQLAFNPAAKENWPSDLQIIRSSFNEMQSRISEKGEIEP